MAKKKKWKKRLGKALMAGAALAGGLALARRGKTPYRNVHETGAITQTPGRETWDPGTGAEYHTPRVRNPLASDKWSNWNANYLMAKGGRVGVGKAKRGFGRALKKGRK